MTKKRKKIGKRTLWFGACVFVLMNISAIFHAYKLTHFSPSAVDKTDDPTHLSRIEKIKTLFFGVNNPRPRNSISPALPYKTTTLNKGKIEIWESSVLHPAGTVVLFHGFSASKSSLIEQASVFHSLGFNTVLVDFMGSGGSAGNRTTIGYFEAEQVTTIFRYLEKKDVKKHSSLWHLNGSRSHHESIVHK